MQKTAPPDATCPISAVELSVGGALKRAHALTGMRRISASSIGAPHLSSAVRIFHRRCASFIGGAHLSSALRIFRRRSASSIGAPHLPSAVRIFHRRSASSIGGAQKGRPGPVFLARGITAEAHGAGLVRPNHEIDFPVQQRANKKIAQAARSANRHLAGLRPDRPFGRERQIGPLPRAVDPRRGSANRAEAPRIARIQKFMTKRSGAGPPKQARGRSSIRRAWRGRPPPPLSGNRAHLPEPNRRPARRLPCPNAPG